RVGRDPDRTRLLHGTRLKRDVLEGTKATLVGDALAGPQPPADLDVFHETIRTLAVGHPERHALARAGASRHQPRARGEQHATARDEIQRRPLVREDEWVTH